MSTVPTYEATVAAAREHPPLVAVDRDGAHAVVTLDDPGRLNPLSAPLTVQLHDALRDLAREPRVKAVVLTGRDPAFCAGGDLRLMTDVAHPMVDRGAGGATDVWRWIRGQFGAIARLIVGTDKAFVAAVNGAAAGVGLAFALACDLILVSDRARIVPAFGRIGLLPEVGNSWLLTRRLGYQRTFALFAGGTHLSGAEALELGLANELHPHEELLGAARDWCERIAALPDHVVAMTKPLLRQCADLSWEQAIAMEELAEPMCFTTAAHREAVRDLLSGAKERSRALAAGLDYDRHGHGYARRRRPDARIAAHVHRALGAARTVVNVALTFSLDDVGVGRCRLRATTRAAFPGLHGSAYRALVIGTGAHLRVTHRMLASVAARAEDRAGLSPAARAGRSGGGA